jgi:hypothetical protein
MSTVFAREISNEEISAAITDMNTVGVGVIRNIFSENTLADCREFVARQLRHYGGEYFSLVGNADHGDSLLGEIGRSSIMHGLLKQAYEEITRKPALPSPIYQVLRVISGETAKSQSYQFHYDAYIVTALAPILIPNGSPEERGDMIIYPNCRGHRSLTMNVIEKMILQNRFIQILSGKPWVRRLFKAKVLSIVPGNLYLFRGYQSFHGNMPVKGTAVRATAIFHYGNPHETSWATNQIQKWRLNHEVRIKERALRR